MAVCRAARHEGPTGDRHYPGSRGATEGHWSRVNRPTSSVPSRIARFRGCSVLGSPAIMPRFVLLEHRWDGVHWDLMLEHGAVLRTWAIDATTEAAVGLPSRALQEHRRIYLEYEGEVSGKRGTVRRADEGVYTALVWEAGRVLVRVQRNQLVGEVEIRQVPGSDA